MYRFFGGLGNDVLSGGAGNDRYVFNLGDGIDTIRDSVAPGEGNEILFGTGITADMLSLGVAPAPFGVGTVLAIRVGAAGDEIHFDPFDPNDAYGTHGVDSFRFVDGTVLAYQQLIDRGFDLVGTADDDVLEGTNATDRFVGGAGNDCQKFAVDRVLVQV